MPRVKEFEPDVALQRALELFWERGYEATSMADLVEHLGIGRASLYATFGSKHELYLKALERYTQTRDPDVVEMLSHPGPVVPAIRRLIETYVEQAVGAGAHRGCMVVNAAVETSADPAVARLVGHSWRAIEVALTTALTRARTQGELAAETDPQALAAFVLVLLQGIKVVGQGDPDPGRIRAAADHALSMLR